MNSKAHKLLTALVAAGALSLVAGSAHAQVAKCKATIAKESAKAAQALAIVGLGGLDAGLNVLLGTGTGFG